MNITQEELEYIKKVNAGDFAVYLIESGIARVHMDPNQVAENLRKRLANRKG